MHPGIKVLFQGFCAGFLLFAIGALVFRGELVGAVATGVLFAVALAAGMENAEKLRPEPR